VRQACVLFSLICKVAVESGRLKVSPCVGIRQPRVRAKEQLIITEVRVGELADACKGYEALVHVLAYGGLRWAEAVGLRKERIDVLGARVHIVRPSRSSPGDCTS
jgi:hypothetical protein